MTNNQNLPISTLVTLTWCISGRDEHVRTSHRKYIIP